MNNWITWWARAQRGVGFMPEKCPPQIQIDIHDMPRCIALRFTFGTCYDCQPVIIKNVIVIRVKRYLLLLKGKQGINCNLSRC